MICSSENKNEERIVLFHKTSDVIIFFLYCIGHLVNLFIVQYIAILFLTDLPGWTQAKMDCGYNDIEYLSSVTPNMCREKCNLNSECVAVLYLFNNLACYLKRMCNQKTNSGTSHLYMPIGKGWTLLIREIC